MTCVKNKSMKCVDAIELDIIRTKIEQVIGRDQNKACISKQIIKVKIIINEYTIIYTILLLFGHYKI